MAYTDIKKRRAYFKARYEARLAQAKEFLGGACVRCGDTEALEFDHIDPATKYKKICEMQNHTLEKFMAEVRKCQLLCYSCHQSKSREDDGRI